jgi:hypothetical protein
MIMHVNLEHEQRGVGADVVIQRHEHVAHCPGRREAIEVVELGVGPRDHEERALGVAVDLRPAIVAARAEAAGEGMERDQRPGQRRPEDGRREEGFRAGAAIAGRAEEVDRRGV